MAKDLIVQEGDPVLRAVAKPVPKKDLGSPALAKIIKKMHKALAPEKYGVAIAAPQIGESLRLFVVAGRVFKEEPEQGQETESQNVQKNSLARDGRSPRREIRGLFSEHSAMEANRVYINPEITRSSRKVLDESEGCLSVRSIYGTVKRHEKVTLRYIDEQGKTHTENASGLLGHIFQHEVDHLNGILFIDKAKNLHESK
jgi:peptide deformylase